MRGDVGDDRRLLAEETKARRPRGGEASGWSGEEAGGRVGDAGHREAISVSMNCGRSCTCTLVTFKFYCSP